VDRGINREEGCVFPDKRHSNQESMTLFRLSQIYNYICFNIINSSKIIFFIINKNMDRKRELKSFFKDV
jgi:hypothetical protein